MKGRFWIRIGIVAAVIAGLWITGRITGMLQSYNVPVSSMEPAIKAGSRIFTTNLKKPNIYDIIVFKRITGENEGLEPGTLNTYCSRLIATGGQTIEIKSGLAYVNGRLVDDSTRLRLTYQFTNSMTGYVAEVLGLDMGDNQFVPRLFPINDSVAMVYATPNDLKELQKKIVFTRVLSNETSGIWGAEEKQWTKDNFGPFTIPSGFFFYLGDNRDFSLDSRFVGPVPEKNIMGVVLGKN
jgi:signal peptidase I